MAICRISSCHKQEEEEESVLHFDIHPTPIQCRKPISFPHWNVGCRHRNDIVPILEPHLGCQRSVQCCNIGENLLGNTEMGGLTPPAVLSRRYSFRLPFVLIDGTWLGSSAFPLLWRSQKMDRFVDRLKRRIIFSRWNSKIAWEMEKSRNQRWIKLWLICSFILFWNKWIFDNKTMDRFYLYSQYFEMHRCDAKYNFDGSNNF